MNYRRLGGSGLKVSEISLGSWLTYGGYVERENAVKAIQTAYGLGINFFDSANVYEQGAAEILLGETIRAFPRESYVLATKAFWPMGDGPNDRGLSRKHVIEQCHASLKRLGTDYVDIFYCHRHDPETPLYETLRAIDDLIRQGKVLYVGVSEWTAAQMAEGLAVADRYLLDRIVVNQPVYNMFNRYIEKEVIPFGEKNGVGQVVFSPLAQGLLTGKYNSVTELPEGSRASKLEWVRNGITEEKINQVVELSAIAAELQITTGQLALAWILRQPNVASALVGASRPEQVEENVKASGIELSADIQEQIEKILKEA
ncbi:voltage-gated potassium channel [Paenibacillus baekrokdamisoli]|uniref:Voltage-gated potassium channel n=1 Tax=Paenibacillus baekrokdamisoli TaxID=1712516 RepID=A0A3G9JNT1_9BACL|nr:aldo/keto reductase family protein [Paenibacillus baekrokdamisoli]MBB3071455.1 voltage-dependent potassium channel beta subunit [Paenibacillus baekrokdamisoli]BBH24514.1 voltage-gated potassium channel [Paenibacillus baekrokdamisoli]